MTRARILVIDDDDDIRFLIRELLERAGHEVSDAPDGRTGVRTFHTVRPDLVVLDVSMPELDGWHTLERIRDMSDTPVLMLTALSGELEKVRGLRGGADDFVTKPFGRQEFVARVDALLRRPRGGADAPEVYEDDVVRIDFAGSSVTVHDEPISLTPLEFRLLAAFVRHANQVLSRDQLLELVWGQTVGVSSDQVKLYVGYLRRKLGETASGEGMIETVRGFGYRYKRPRAR